MSVNAALTWATPNQVIFVVLFTHRVFQLWHLPHVSPAPLKHAQSECAQMNSNAILYLVEILHYSNIHCNLSCKKIKLKSCLNKSDGLI